VVTITWPSEVVVDEGERFVLRMADPIDAAALVDAINDSLQELRPWMPWAAEPATVDQQAVRLALVAEAAALGGDGAYTLFVGDQVAGIVGIHDRLGDPSAREIGYWLRSSFAGRGLMTRAVRAVVEVLRTSSLERIEIHCDEANHRSAGVAARAGFTLLRIVDDDAREAPASTMRTMIWERSLTGD
jgi:RimJ/RimL family protein N-acetyltransferase